MRFKANLPDAGVLLRLLSSLEKIDQRLVLHLRPDKMCFIARSDAELGLQAHCTLFPGEHFEEYTVESKADNNIYFKALVANLLRALKSAQAMQEVALRLSKKRLNGADKASPCLTFETKREGAGGQYISVVHDVPLVMLNERELESFAEPELDPAVVELYMPPMKIFRSVVDRFKTLTSQITLRATGDGLLSLIATPVCLEAQIDFHQCASPITKSDNFDPDAVVELTLDLKKLSRVLSADRLNSNDIIAAFHDGTALVLHFIQQNNWFASFYIPLTALDPDGGDDVGY